jgi:hypothetical protein
MIGIQLKALKEEALESLEMTCYLESVLDVKVLRQRLARQSEEMLMVLAEMDRLRAVEDTLHGVLGEKTEALEAAKEDLEYAVVNDLRMRESLVSEQIQRLVVEIAVLKEVIDA